MPLIYSRWPPPVSPTPWWLRVTPPLNLSMKRYSSLLLLALCAGTSGLASTTPPPPIPRWKHLSSRTGELPVPNGGLQQTTAVVFDVDGDGVNDFVLGERTEAPGVIWLRRTATGWEKYMVDDGPRRTEAGGLAYDVDGDGDPDFIVGGDYKSNEVWWYENPRPAFVPATPWKRHLIKQSGVTEHHDQAMADFMRTQKPQLMFWNQKAKKLFMAERPDKQCAGPCHQQRTHGRSGHVVGAAETEALDLFGRKIEAVQSAIRAADPKPAIAIQRQTQQRVTG